MVRISKKEESDIVLFFHCNECLEELPIDESPSSYQRINVGWTKLGFQVWCIRHRRNVFNVDFMGQKVKYIKDKK